MCNSYLLGLVFPGVSNSAREGSVSFICSCFFFYFTLFLFLLLRSSYFKSSGCSLDHFINTQCPKILSFQLQMRPERPHHSCGWLRIALLCPSFGNFTFAYSRPPYSILWYLNYVIKCTTNRWISIKPSKIKKSSVTTNTMCLKNYNLNCTY